MELRLMLDEDVHLSLADALRKRGYDAVHVAEILRRGKTDHEQLEYATVDGKCFFSFNVGHLVALHNGWMINQREHAGIIVSKHYAIGHCLHRLLTFLQTTKAEDMYNQIRFLR